MSSDLTLTTAALAIFVLCAGFMILRGVTRALLSMAVLAASGFLAFLAWKSAPAWSVHWFGKPQEWYTAGLPILVFVTSFLVLRYLVKCVLGIFSNPSGESDKRTFFGTVFRFIFSIVPTSAILAGGAALIHHTGSVEEIRATSGKSTPPASFIQQLKSSVAKAIPADWMKTLDPSADPSRLALAKLIAAEAKSTRKPVIDPATGKPIPRAVIVADPELQSLAKSGDFSALLRHPLLTKALNDPKVQKALSGLKL